MITDPFRFYEYQGVPPTYFAGTLPTVNVQSTYPDDYVANAVRQGGSRFFGTAGRFMGQPQRDMMELFTGVEQTPSEYFGIENPVGAFVTDAVTDPLNLIGAAALTRFARLGMAPLQQGIKSSGRYLTQGPLRNAWRLNPKAYQYNLPENTMWRGLGQEGMEDAISSGLFRAKQDVIPEYYPGTKLQLNKSFGTNPYFTPKFKTAATYGDDYLAEVPRDAANWKQRYLRSNWSQVADRPIPINEGRILTKDWWRGYKPVNTPKR